VSVLNKKEFKKRFVSYIIKLSDMSEDDAAISAEVWWDDYDGIYTPEECVDEEISNWD